MDVAGCRHSAERANYIDFGETSEQTAPRLSLVASPPTAQLHTTATNTRLRRHQFVTLWTFVSEEITARCLGQHRNVVLAFRHKDV